MSGAQVEQLLVLQGQVVDGVPEPNGGHPGPGPGAGGQVVAGQQGLAAAVQLQQLVLGLGGGPAEQVDGGHGQPPIGVSRRSTVRRALSSKRGSSPSWARSTSKRRPSWASASRSAMSAQASSVTSGAGSTRRAIRSKWPSRVSRSWNSSTAGNSRTIPSTARWYTLVPRTSFMSSTRPRMPPSYRSKPRPQGQREAGTLVTRSAVR